MSDLDALTAAQQPALRAEVGCGPIVAAVLIGQTAGARRFRSDAQFARQAGVALIPASFGNTRRHPLHRGGNRQLNKALHIIALNRTASTSPPRHTFSANARPARPAAKRRAASSATWPATSGACSTTAPRR